VAYTLAEKDLIPEGVAYDAKGKKLYVGSIHKRKILSIDARGVVKDFILKARMACWRTGYESRSSAQVLWVCSIADVKIKN
jgi:sugar lactone lactonase YvrE